MSTRDQEEEKFRKKRLKKHGVIDVTSANNSTPIKTDATSFSKFFLLFNGKEKIIIAVVVSVFVCIPIYKLYAEKTSALMLTLMLSLPFIISLVLAYLYLLHFYNNHKRLLNGTLYPVTGWDNFIGSLSTDFWEGTHYVYLQAEIQPAPSATQEERKRLFDFCTHWVQQWTNKFGTKTNSRDHQVFSLNHFTIGGHFALGKQSVFVIHKLVNELSEVMKQNRPNQATIEIRYKGEIFIETGTGEQNRADEIMEEIRQRNEDKRWMED